MILSDGGTKAFVVIVASLICTVCLLNRYSHQSSKLPPLSLPNDYQLRWNRDLSATQELLILHNHPPHHPHLHTTWFGHTFPAHEWIKVKEAIHCMVSHSEWKKTELSPYTNQPINKTFESLSPCPNVYNLQEQCPKILSGGDTVKWRMHLKAETCPNVRWQSFNHTTFCDLMGLSGGNWMAVGDSTTTQFSISVMNSIFQSYRAQLRSSSSSSAPPPNPLPIEKTCAVCDYMCAHAYELPECNATFSDFRNDILSLTLKDITDNFGNIHEKPWMPHIASQNISLLILNRGAHYQNTSKVLHDLNTTLSSYLRSNFPHTNIIFKNTPHGNWAGASDVHLYDDPLIKDELDEVYMTWEEELAKARANNQSIDEMIQKNKVITSDGDRNIPPLSEQMLFRIRDKVMGPSYEPGWGNHELNRQNFHVRHFLEYHFPEVLYLDTASVMNLRGDSHVDAIHYCIPGPMEGLVDLIYNILVIIARFARNQQAGVDTVQSVPSAQSVTSAQ